MDFFFQLDKIRASPLTLHFPFWKSLVWYKNTVWYILDAHICLNGGVVLLIFNPFKGLLQHIWQQQAAAEMTLLGVKDSQASLSQSSTGVYAGLVIWNSKGCFLIPSPWELSRNECSSVVDCQWQGKACVLGQSKQALLMSTCAIKVDM